MPQPPVIPSSRRASCDSDTPRSFRRKISFYNISVFIYFPVMTNPSCCSFYSATGGIFLLVLYAGGQSRKEASWGILFVVKGILIHSACGLLTHLFARPSAEKFVLQVMFLQRGWNLLYSPITTIAHLRVRGRVRSKSTK